MAQDLQALAVLHNENPSPENREAVVVGAIPLVRSLVGRISIPDHPQASKEDLENVGLLGLLQALDGYDPEKGMPFVSYAYNRIRGALIDYLRSLNALPTDRRLQLASAQYAIETLRQQLGTEPDDQQVAEHMGLSLTDFQSLLADTQTRFALSLYGTLDKDERLSLPETTFQNEDLLDFDKVDKASLHANIDILVKELAEREQAVLTLYYSENLTLREIAELLGLTEAQISQVLGRVLLRLRSKLFRSEKSPKQLTDVSDLDQRNSSDFGVITFHIDPGTATPEEIGELLAEFSTLYRLMGGSGLSFTPKGINQMIEVA